MQAQERPRERRSDGERTHEAILETSTQLASIEGIEGLTIGRLADELGVSKSGVYAHFGSKRQLQLETINAAWAIFEREVIEPTMAAPAGIARLEAHREAHLSYIERLVFPGGCFFASLLAEMDARSGEIHEMARDGVASWLGRLADLVREAVQAGDLDSGTDPDQLAFEIDSALELANYYYVLFRDPAVIERARRSIEGALFRRVSDTGRPASSSP